jgi:hypothetical protein
VLGVERAVIADVPLPVTRSCWSRPRFCQKPIQQYGPVTIGLKLKLLWLMSLKVPSPEVLVPGTPVM